MENSLNPKFMKQQEIYTLRIDRSEEGSYKILRSQLVVESKAFGYYVVEDVVEGGGGQQKCVLAAEVPHLVMTRINQSGVDDIGDQGSRMA